MGRSMAPIVLLELNITQHLLTPREANKARQNGCGRVEEALLSECMMKQLRLCRLCHTMLLEWCTKIQKD